MNAVYESVWLSLRLALWTTLILLPIGILLGRWLANSRSRWSAWVDTAVLLPLLLPPTVLGYYLLVTFSPTSAIGAWFQAQFHVALTFSFIGLVLASLIANLPFAVQPIQQAFATLPADTREAAKVHGLSAWTTFWRIELPQTWTGLVSAATLTFAHTLGEFGVVLMVGGNIAGETRTLSIAIYDSVQAFDMKTASWMTATLLFISVLALIILRSTSTRHTRLNSP